MKKIALIDISVGSKFSEDVFIDQSSLFIPANVEVKSKDIDTLKKWGIDFVYTDGHSHDAAKDSERQIPSEEDQKKLMLKLKREDFLGSSELFANYEKYLNKLAEIFRQIANKDSIEAKPVDDINQFLIGLLRGNQEENMTAILSMETSFLNYPQLAIKGAYVAGILGTFLKLPQHILANLITGMLLHDVGMILFPDIISSQKELTDESDLLKIKKHSILSYKIVTKELMYSDQIGLVALQHHERWDGQGYPNGLKEDAINDLARLASIADAYIAMTSTKAYRRAMTPYTAIKSLLSDNGKAFDPAIVKTFVKCLGLYPPGSIVVLSNSSIARTLSSKTDTPLKPRVRILVDTSRKKYPEGKGEVIDLSLETTLYISKTILASELKLTNG